MKQAEVYLYDRLAGILTESDEGYRFCYDTAYLASEDAEAISLTLPLTSECFTDKVLFPFFDGLIPEGWLLNIAERNWKIRCVFFKLKSAHGLDYDVFIKHIDI